MADYVNRVFLASCKHMSEIPNGVVQTCVTSPPYYGLRDYGIDGQIGLEASVEAYVERLVGVFREVRRVLRDDGTLWLNLGDSYAGSWGAQGRHGDSSDTLAGNANYNRSLSAGQIAAHPKRTTNTGTIRDSGLKPKDLIGVPWRVAFALQADGWWLRDAIIWHKPNPMPSSVDDRCTPAYETVFMLTKSAIYYADMDAVRLPLASPLHAPGNKPRIGIVSQAATDPALDPGRTWGQENGANLRNVWTITTKPYADAHFATFPLELPSRCIQIGSSEAGCCSFCGAPYKRKVEAKVEHLSGSGVSGNPIVGKNANGAGGQARENHDVRSGPTRSVRTIGFEPTCRCGVGVQPCLVLDPFMGSGTTAQAAEALGRSWVGYELNPEYHELIAARTRQRGLFSA